MTKNIQIQRVLGNNLPILGTIYYMVKKVQNIRAGASTPPPPPLPPIRAMAERKHFLGGEVFPKDRHRGPGSRIRSKDQD